MNTKAVKLIRRSLRAAVSDGEPIDMGKAYKVAKDRFNKASKRERFLIKQTLRELI